MSLYDLGDAAKLRLTTFNSAGTAQDAGDVTLTITRPDGTTVVEVLADLTHTPGTGIYDYLYAPTMIGQHQVAWAATGQNQAADIRFFDVYGATIAEPADLRARFSGGGNGGDLSSEAAYPDSLLRAKLRDAVEQWNMLAKVAMAPYSNLLSRRGDGCRAWLLPHVPVRAITSLTIGGTVVSPTLYVVDQEAGIVELLAGTFTLNQPVVIHYEHGLDYPPEPVSQAIMTLTAEYLTRKALSSRAITEVTDVGTFNLSVAGIRKPTGIPEVDRIVQDFGRKTPLVG